jgi:hypothetical protein
LLRCCSRSCTDASGEVHDLHFRAKARATADHNAQDGTCPLGALTCHSARSFGVLLHEVCSGKRPDGVQSLSVLRHAGAADPCSWHGRDE